MNVALQLDSMPSISVERTIGKTKKSGAQPNFIGYNTEKMGKQKYKRLVRLTVPKVTRLLVGLSGEVWTTVLFIQLFWIEQKLRGKNYGKKLIRAD